MAAKKKAAKAGAAAVAVKNSPYVQRVIEDEELRENLWQAYASARDAAARLGNGKSPTKQIFDDKKLQKELQQRRRVVPRRQRRAARGAQAEEGPELRPAAPADDRQRRHRARRLRGPAQEGARRAVRRRGGVRVHLDDQLSLARRRRPPAPAPRPAAAGCPRGSRPPRRPRSRGPSRRRRAPSERGGVRRGLLSRFQAVEDLLHQPLGPFELEREHAEPDEDDRPAGPGQRNEREPDRDDEERADHEHDPVGAAALEVALAPARELLGQRQVLLGRRLGAHVTPPR